MDMNKKQITVDRIENGLAVCESGGDIVDIPLSKISGSVQEGDILYESDDGAGYLISKEETDLRRAAIQDRFDRLKARK